MTIDHRICCLAAAALIAGCGAEEEPAVQHDAAPEPPESVAPADPDTGNLAPPTSALAAGTTADTLRAAPVPGDSLALVDALKMVLSSASTPAELHLKLGQTYLRSGQYQQSADEFILALEADPTSMEAQSGIARALNRLADPAAARETLEDLLVRHPDAALLLVSHAKTLRRAGEIEAAVQELTRAVELSDADPTAQIELHLTTGRQLRMTQDNAGAIGEYKMALALDPDNAQATLGLHLTQARLHAAKGDHDAAVDAARKAVDSGPTSTQALYAYHSNMGKLLKESGQYEEAITEFVHCTELAPKSAGAANALGSIYLAAQRFDDAAAHLKRAVDLDSTHLGARHGLAKAYERLQWHDLARDAWSQVLVLDSEGRYQEEARLHIQIIDQISDLSPVAESGTRP